MWMGNSIRWHYSTIISECKAYQARNGVSRAFKEQSNPYNGVG